MPIFPAKYPGVCQCGARVAKGSMIDYRRAIVACNACNPELAPAPPDAEGVDAPAQPVAPRCIPTYSAEAREALLARLDADQKAVAAWTPADGNLRVIAAAGSGKTTTVTALVGNLLAGSHVTPRSLVVTTFTRKAADELVERLARVVPHAALNDVRVGTFHSLALTALRQVDRATWSMDRCADAARRTRARDVLGTDLLWGNALGMGNIRSIGEPGVDVPEDLRRDYVMAVEVIRSRNIRFGTEAAADACNKLSSLPGLYTAWRLYDLQKKAQRSFDFGDALDAYLDGLQGRDWGNVVVVDEAQDNDVRQVLLARALAGTSGRVLLVGDVRQSIYEWRGGAPDLFANADRDIGAHTLYLPRNYRSGSSIVDVGNAIAEGRAWSIGPAAAVGSPDRQGTGKVTVTGHNDYSHTVEAVAANIAAAARDGVKPSDFAILCRTRAQQAGYEAALLEANVPVAIVGGSSYFGSKAWRDFAATLAAVANESDEESLKRLVMREPHCGFFAARDVTANFGQSRDSYTALQRGAQLVRTDRTRAALFALAAWIHSTRQVQDFAKVCDLVAERLCAGTMASADGDEDVRAGYEAAASIAARQGNARAALAFAQKCEGASADADVNAAGRVTISTIHKSKGREWPTVYVDATAGLFPHARCEGDERRMEEEARLFYVAATRAEHNLHLTFAALDMRGKPAGRSEFLDFVKVAPLPPRGGGEPVPATPADRVTCAACGTFTAVDSLNAAGECPECAAAPVEIATAEIAEAAPASLPTAAALREALVAFAPVAERLTANAAPPVKGQRFVPVSTADFDALLGSHGFTSDVTLERRTGQRVLAAPLADGSRVVVYTSIPAGQEIARGLGEDSIKVARVNADGRPMMSRQAYAARTVNWRRALLARIDSALAV